VTDFPGSPIAHPGGGSSITLSQGGSLVAPSDSVIWKIQPRDPSYAPFAALLTSHLFGSVTDYVMTLGYNPLASSTPIVAAEPTWQLGFESRYYVGPGQELCEWYLEAYRGVNLAAGLNGFSVRPFYGSIDRFTGETRSVAFLGYGQSAFNVIDTNQAIIGYVKQASNVVRSASSASISTIGAGDAQPLTIDGVSFTVTFQAGDNALLTARDRINAAARTAGVGGGSPYLPCSVDGGFVAGGGLVLTARAAGSIVIGSGTATSKLGFTAATTTATPATSSWPYNPAYGPNWTYQGPDTSAPNVAAAPTNTLDALDRLAYEKASEQAQIYTSVIANPATMEMILPEHYMCYRADAGYSVAGTWTDLRSGLAPSAGIVSAVQATGAKQPALNSTNGPVSPISGSIRKCLRFTRASAQQLAATMTIAKPFTIIIICRFVNAVSGSDIGICDGLTLDTAIINRGNNSSINMRHGATLTNTNGNGDNRNWTLIVASFTDGSDSSLSVLSAGGILTTVTGSSGTNAAPTGIKLATAGDDSNPSDLWLPEVRVLKGGTLSAVQMAATVAYAKYWYGIV